MRLWTAESGFESLPPSQFSISPSKLSSIISIACAYELVLLWPERILQGRRYALPEAELLRLREEMFLLVARARHPPQGALRGAFQPDAQFSIASAFSQRASSFPMSRRLRIIFSATCVSRNKSTLLIGTAAHSTVVHG